MKTPDQTRADALADELAVIKYQLATRDLADRYNSAKDRGDHVAAAEYAREHDRLVAAHARGVVK